MSSLDQKRAEAAATRRAALDRVRDSQRDRRDAKLASRAVHGPLGPDREHRGGVL